MRKSTVIWLIIAAALVLLGCMIFGGMMYMLKWDFGKLSTVKYETNTYDLHPDFQSISVNTDTADIVFAPSGDGSCKVVCHEEAKARHTVMVTEDTLTIQFIDERSVYDYTRYIGINMGSPKITVYLPEGTYTSLLIRESTGDVRLPAGITFGDVDISLSTGNVDFAASATGAVKIRTSTGDIRVEDISAGSLDLTVTTGKVTAGEIHCDGDIAVRVSTGKASLSDIACENLVSSGNTGDISLTDVIAAGQLSITRTTGGVQLDKCDAGEICVTTSTGGITGTLLTDKVFITDTGTGSVSVPKTTTGGKCELTTSTGNIRIEIAKN